MTDAKKRIVHRAINPLLSSLPDWAESYRPHQKTAIEEIMEAFQRVDVVVLDAPTGSGKTLIGETVRRMLELPSLYMCATKSLQDQFARDFPYAKVLKGRANYPTQSYPDRFHPDEYMGHLSCEDCTWTAEKRDCAWCVAKSLCPYELAKKAALNSPLSVVNTSYFLAECNRVGKFRGRFVIADEADTLESELMSFVSVDISERRMERWGWQPPDKVTVPSSWMEWIDNKLPQLHTKISKLDENSGDLKELREFRYLDRLIQHLVGIREGLDTEDHPWVYTGKGAEGSGRVKERNKGLTVSFKPSRVDGMGKVTLWRHGVKWLLMSATVISADELLSSLGWDGDYELVKVPSTFPIQNRRVVYAPVADMAAKHKDTSWPEVADAIAHIAARHRDDRMLVHTVSYDLAAYVVDRLTKTTSRRSITYTNAAGRESSLAEYLATPNAILVAPSMDRGIDLPGDACRVQIIAKVPFPYLGDRQVSTRMHSRGGDVWYKVQTIRTLVQMCGRAVRSETDFAVTYILDTQFQNGLWSRTRGLIPSWFSEAVDWRSGGEIVGRRVG